MSLCPGCNPHPLLPPATVPVGRSWGACGLLCCPFGCDPAPTPRPTPYHLLCRCRRLMAAALWTTTGCTPLWCPCGRRTARCGRGLRSTTAATRRGLVMGLGLGLVRDSGTPAGLTWGSSQLAAPVLTDPVPRSSASLEPCLNRTQTQRHSCLSAGGPERHRQRGHPFHPSAGASRQPA